MLYIIMIKIFRAFFYFVIPKYYRESDTRFSTSGFFINQCPQGLRVSHQDRFEFFRKFSEIIANECLSAVSTTPAKKDKNFEIKFLKYSVKSLVLCTLHLKIEFCLFFIFRCRQANIGRTLYWPVSLTPLKNLSVVSLTPTINFSIGYF